jgi:hypothetical protein
MNLLQQVVSQVPAFLAEYDAAATDATWLHLRQQFRTFWAARIMGPDPSPISDADCDAVIRILDRNAKGNTKGSHAISRAMIAQGAWRRMLNLLHLDKTLGTLLDAILNATSTTARGAAIDSLYAANAGVPNYLTGPSGNAVCTFLAAHDPLNNLSIISLKDRHALLSQLDVTVPFDWETATVGTKIAMSNELIVQGAQGIGLQASARTLTTFFYTAGVEPLWKGTHTVAMPDGVSIAVSVPSADDDDGSQAAVGACPVPLQLTEPAAGKASSSTAEEVGAAVELQQVQAEIGEAMQIQALLAKIGTEMGFKIWLPKADRGRVTKAWSPGPGELVNSLPLGYDPTTTATIEQIDVLWLKGRSIVRAFEVEHTTSIYSGLLRMADLVALQPNIAVKLHIVASVVRREKVLREIRRPVFSLLDGLVLWKTCTFLSYDRVREISDLKHLDHLKDAVLNEYEEAASDGDGAP